jgi:hypothetical protein
MRTKVLSTMFVLFLCAGCVQPTPSGTPASSSGASAPSNCPNGYYQCEWLPSSTSWYAWQSYFKTHHPKEAADLDSNREEWIIKDSETLVVLTNPVTGFRWEGTVGWREISLGECCVGTMPEAYIVKESVTTVPTVAPTRTGVLTPTE